MTTLLNDPNTFWTLIYIGVFVFLLVVLFTVWKRYQRARVKTPSTTTDPIINKERAIPINALTFKMSLENIAMAAAGASIALAILNIFVPILFWIAILIGMSTMLPIGIFFGYIISSNFYIKILRKITKRNYGFIKFVYGGKAIKTILANLDKDIIHFADGIYMVDKQLIKRQLPIGVSEDTVTHRSVDQEVKFEEGMPTIYYNIDDLIPIDFAIQGRKTDEQFRSPAQAAATLNKEIAVEKAKAMQLFKQRENIFLLIMIALVVVNLYFGYTTFSSQDSTNKILNKLNGFADGVNQYISRVSTNTSQIGQVGR